MWKPPIITVSDHIFPGLAYHDRENEFYNIENRIQSNLPLQMALYFNVRLFPIWFIIFLFNLEAKYYTLSEVYRVVTVAVFAIISILECLRLYLGYLGNLSEKIPELASFWLISTLIQLPLEIFMLSDYRMMQKLREVAVNSCMLFLLVTEIIAGTVALKILADHHAKRFYVSKLYGVSETRF